MYQKYISPHKGFHCAYHHLHPNDKTCSEYGKYTIKNHGVFTGLKLLNDRFDACKNAAKLIKIANIIRNQNPQNCDEACDSIGNDCSRGCAEGRDALWREIKVKIDEEVSKIKNKITDTIKKIWNETIEWISGIIQDIFNKAEETIDQTTDEVEDAITPNENLEDELRGLVDRAIATPPTDIQFDEIIDEIIENYEEGHFANSDNDRNELWDELPPPYRIVVSAKMNIGESSGITSYGFDPAYNNEKFKEAIEAYVDNDKERAKEIIQDTCHEFENGVTTCYSDPNNAHIVENILNRIESISPTEKFDTGTEKQQNIEAQQILGVRMQCKEWVDTIANSNGGSAVRYDGTTTGLSIENASPGKAVYKKNHSHSAIITGLIRNSGNVIIGLNIAESNMPSNGNEWKLPNGQIPWNRNVKAGKILSQSFNKWKIADIY